ncbi:MAG: DUF859 family phage minor structural protein [Anaerostipes sp.]|uniref:DUF859 family phage minor structural protein n=1 Tax=Anaerostipes sp. TaxID=1872530 RepID=UPI0039917B0D
MAKSGSITTNQKEGRSVTLSWTLSNQDIANNTSTIAWTLKGSGSGSGWVMAGGFNATINGTTVYSTSTDTRIKLYNGTTIASGSLKISHNSDGSKSFSLSCQAGVYTYAVSVTASGTHTLNTIPRASSVSATNTNLSAASTITITRASSAFTHTLTYAFGGTTGTIVSKTTSTSVYWTPALTLANQIPNAVSGTCTITCDTYNGSTKIGTKTCTLTLTVPSTVKPTMTSVTATRVDGDVPSDWAIYVQSKSKATVTINGAAGAYGSTISSYSITGGGYSSTASSFTTGFLTSSGTITFTARVTDSRGRVSDEKTVSITVVAYSAPSFTSYLSQRATSAGVVNDDGTYIRGLISYSYASCSSKNTVTRATYYKKSSTTTWTNANESFSSGTAFTFGGGAISTESSYDVKYTLTDAFTTVTILDTVSTASVLMDFKAGGKGIAIGKVAEKEKTLEIADSWELEVHGKKLIDYIYPIGSIYMSVNSTSPATLFGGSWTQIKDRFLLGAGSTYSAGATGGAATHKLSVSEMPSHAHDTPFFNNMTNNGEMKSDFIGVFGKGVTASQALKNTGQSSTMEMWWINQTNTAEGNEWAYLTSAKGSGSAHNNMPPYLVVYMWKRTA